VTALYQIRTAVLL